MQDASRAAESTTSAASAVSTLDTTGESTWRA